MGRYFMFFGKLQIGNKVFREAQLLNLLTSDLQSVYQSAPAALKKMGTYPEQHCKILNLNIPVKNLYFKLRYKCLNH